MAGTGAGAGAGGGLKHVATEPAHFDNKRERARRGAAGRAAALRRAPSDSDCSGETASLSADSADRVRTVLPAPRQTKSRRRRGSEWEVLEGLKDGQRFERRPEVFNGYLHKKRKWPLKGWHKRFFVVDGGILVYARSPTDVARGRLHGSVDVGLSVISAKARRRRIDIDADEFIYHLRAKTPDVFRTWLNVLKTHRLYRQHLLTFGAREPVPKIHAPDDLPPTDISSHSSFMTELSDSDVSCNSDLRTIFTKSSLSSSAESIKMSLENNICNKNPVQDWNRTHLDNEELIPLSFEPLSDQIVVKTDHNLIHSLCSMHCMEAFYKDEIKKFQDAVDLSKITDKERQVLSTNLDKISQKTYLCTEAHVFSVFLEKDSNLTLSPSLPAFDDLTPINDETNDDNKGHKETLFRESRDTTFFLFKHKNSRVQSGNVAMRKSNKSTNLFRYKNLIREPPLEKPISNSVILRTNRVSTRAGDDTVKKSGGARNFSIKDPNSVVDAACSTHCDLIAEKLIKTFLHLDECSFENVKNIQLYVSHIMQEASAFKSNSRYHHVKLLFKGLLEYWLESNSMDGLVQDMRKSHMECDKVFKTVGTQIYSCTKDAKLSSTGLCTPKIYKITQTSTKGSLPKKSNPKKVSLTPSQYLTFSFVKEKRVQELERLLQNTVYTIETVRSQSNLNFKYKDIEITKKLMDNLEPLSSAKDNSQTCLLHATSSEYSKIQKTLNNLIGETSMNSTIAKDILGAYLQVLTDDNKSLDSASCIEESKGNSNCRTPSLNCDVQTDPVQRKVSIGTLTAEIEKYDETIKVDRNKDETKETISNETSPDPGQIYLKEVLDKVSTYFKTFKPNGKKNQHLHTETKVDGSPRESPCSYYTSNTDDSLVLDLTKYDLLQIALLSESSINGEMSIRIKLKERTPNSKAINPTNVILKLSEAEKPVYENTKHARIANTSAKSYFRRINSRISFKNPYSLNLDTNYDLKPFLSNSDATSKAYKVMYEKNDAILPTEHESKKSFDFHEDHQSCYMLSNLKRSAVPSMFCSKRRNKKEFIERQDLTTTINAKRQDAPATTNATRIIDEKFILIMLENLTLLSRNIPTLHKEILSLYMKLKKKHDKGVREPPGLGLLGKIYNTLPEDMYAECNDGNPEGLHRKLFEPQELVSVSAQVSTSPDIWRLVNESTSVYAVTDNEAQTILMFDFNSIGVLKATKHTSVTDFDRPRLSYHEDANIKGSRSQKLEMESREQNMGNYLRSLLNFLITTRSFNTDDKQTKMQTEDELLKKIDLQNKIVHSRVRSDKKELITPKISKLFPSNIKNSNQIVDRKPMISHTLPSCLVEQTQKATKLFDRKSKHKGFNIYYARSSYNPVQIMMPNREVKVIYKSLDRSSSVPSLSAGLVSPASHPFRVQAGFVAGTPGGRLANWIVESGGPLENASRELGQAQLSVQQLQRLLDALELQHHHHDTDVSLEGASPNVKKDRRKFGLRKKKSNSKCASVELQPIAPSPSHMALSALTAPPSPGGGASSVPNSAASLPIACAASRPQSLPGAEALGGGGAGCAGGGPASLASLTPDQQLRDDFTVLAKDLVATLTTVLATLVCERGRLRAAMEAAEGGAGGGGGAAGGGAAVAALRTNLSSALQQNSELRTRLSRIHDASDLADISSVNNTDPAARPFPQSLSFSSSCVSASEFFDAEEHEPPAPAPPDLLSHDEAGVIELDGDSSSEAGSLSSEEGSASSDNSDGALLSAEPAPLPASTGPGGAGLWSRRTALPCPRPTPGGPSLWNLLYKNIGKDLSQVSMPVTINEPLNMLQRLCEELEYSELLDAAAECNSPLERLALVGAFAVSAYAASAHRAASKPFNPLLHETYECVRGDRGFRFLAEQVSHHPPISACHAESSRWVLWQEARIKTKFWGKSMEFQPAGRVHVRLLTTGDHYSWNKVTTCVHNLFGGQRWVDQYGDMHIVCHGTDLSAKLNFVKASSWSSSRHEVRGWAAGGGARLRLAGRWSEALHAGEPPAARCLWRPGAMPPEHELYYGFTRFAMELNEMEPGLRELLPRTDTRLRPDQRALEEGDVDAAESYKLQLERAQRDRRGEGPPPHPAWFRKALEDGEEMWVFTGEYWRARDAGFPPPPAPLW